MHETLTMLPEAQARRCLADAVLHLEVVRPPYPALGIGALRVLRIRPRADSAALVLSVGYDNYERLP